MLAAAMMAVLLMLTGGGVLVGSAVIARHRAQAAADLGALAAASRLAAGPDAACAATASLAEAMHTSVASCDVEGLDVVVVVQLEVDFGRWGVGAARASARAGPE